MLIVWPKYIIAKLILALSIYFTGFLVNSKNILKVLELI